MKRYVFAASLLVSVLILACAGGKNTPPPPPPPSGASATFQPDTAPPGAGVMLNAGGSQQVTFTVDVVAQSISSATYGAAFDFDFDPNLLTFANHVPGTFFEQGGIPNVNYQVATAPGNPGKLVVGVSLQSSHTGVTGTARIVSLRFNIQSRSGTARLSFSGHNLVNPNGQIGPAIPWTGGTVQTRTQ